MIVCPSLNGRAELHKGFAVYPVPRPLYLHDPPRPAWDCFNAFLRRNAAGQLTWNPDYQWGDQKVGHRGVDLGSVRKPCTVSQPEGLVRSVDLIDNTDAGVNVDILTKCSECGGWFLFRYLHLEPGSVVVKRDQRVSQGDLIGTQGRSGNAHWYHSHFEIRHTINPFADKWITYGSAWGTPYDPLAWLDATLTDIPLPIVEDTMFCKKGDGVGGVGSAVVKYWQLRLNRLGASLIADGKYGTLTQNAVIAYAGGDGLQIGPDEAEKLDALAVTSPVLAPFTALITPTT